jgi:hypothetical protein
MKSNKAFNIGIKLRQYQKKEQGNWFQTLTTKGKKVLLKEWFN